MRYFGNEIIILRTKNEADIVCVEGLTFKNEASLPVSATKERNDRN
jgi:hypothetical protein